jgi:hypothetical protein
VPLAGVLPLSEVLIKVPQKFNGDAAMVAVVGLG